MRIAALTMVWNEPYFLPLWLRHHARQLGADNCFVLDHGSDDGSTDALGGAQRVRLPRTPLDEEKRARAVSSMAASLLSFYDVVIHSDTDELVVPDPALFRDLPDFCARCPHDVVTTIGFDVQHDPGAEPALDPARPVSLQRDWLRFISPMCKPALIRRPVSWQPGFHSCDAPIHFEPFYMFHLRRADLDQGLTRLARTRAMTRAFDWANPHQQIPDEQFRNDLVYGVSCSERRTDVTLRPDEPPLAPWLRRIEAEQHDRAGEMYRLDLGLVEQAYWRLPERFRGTF